MSAADTWRTAAGTRGASRSIAIVVTACLFGCGSTRHSPLGSTAAEPPTATDEAPSAPASVEAAAGTSEELVFDEDPCAEWTSIACPGQPRVEPTRVEESLCGFTDLEFMRAPLFRVRSDVVLASSLPGATPSRYAPASPGSVESGALVLGSAELRGYRCVYTADPTGVAHAGFVATELLERVDDPPPPSAAELVGDWRSANERPAVARETAHFRIALAGESLSFIGEAFWGGSGGYDLHFGDAAGSLQYEGGIARLVGRDGVMLAPGACAVWLEPRGPFLMVGDDRECGGANVSFTDIYVRSPVEIPFLPLD